MTTSFKSSVFRRLEGKVALITGGASGIGESTVRLFVQHGAKVVIADVQDDLGHSLCKELDSQEAVSYVHCDVTRDTDVEKAVDLAVSKYGQLDIMFSNAGIAGKLGSTILDSDNEEAKRVIDVDLFGPFLTAKHAARVMIPARKGCILFTSSMLSTIVTAKAPHEYVAAKHGVVGLTKSMCVELGAHGIRVNCVSPYMVATPIFQKIASGLNKTEVEKLASAASNLKEAVLEPEDIAHAALYLVSDEAKYVSGVNLVVDGGYSASSSALTDAIENLLSQN
ncbi:hypothetical protein K2173_012184 [Erythroxylum novogranatense]|uniref:Secoisolariciresinol dehydrogenase n=1 Tax=Erythroxylum novogranatense TaxID=1862640 RepID=A0AAV8SRE1_9ROSI|nr:hypothetical protein K2173_012184 [Erythroxylum novogranatense]